MKEKIIQLSKSIGIDLIGFCKIEYDPILESKLIIQEKNGYKCSFQVGKIEDKCFKSDRFKKYNSAIVIGISYNSSNNLVNNLHVDNVYFSTHAWGKDYHLFLREKLNILGEYIKKQKGIYDVFVDNNILDERYLAYKSGLGFYGKNNLLINEQFGSYFFIGVLLTDLRFEYDKPLTNTCFNCNKCVDMCPTSSIKENGLNSNTCLSYLTQKKNIDESFSKYFNQCIYGCDICTRVCPHNKDIQSNNNFVYSGVEIVNANELLNMNVNEYANKYSKLSAFWVSKDVIDRNIKFYLKNRN